MCHSETMNKKAIRSLQRLCLLFGGFVVGTQVQAQGVECLASSDPDAVDIDLPRCEDINPYEQLLAPESPWRIGAAVGFGERSNPLINANDRAMYGFIQFSYFGDRFFFDNGDFGWSLAAQENWSANLIAGIGGERSFFSYLDGGSGGFSPGVDSGFGQLPSIDPTAEELASVEAPDRDRSIDGGLELISWWRGSELMLQLVTDISDRHNGQEAWVSWAYPYTNGRWDLVPSVGAVWKSGKNADYYFGVRDEEAQPGLPAYEANASFNPFVRLSLSYTLSAHWKVLSVLRYEALDNEILDSPAVVDKYVSTAFFGLYYEF